jgi:hypothetical protein
MAQLELAGIWTCTRNVDLERDHGYAGVADRT